MSQSLQSPKKGWEVDFFWERISQFKQPRINYNDSKSESF